MTLRELAKLIDVSPATISIVLNGKSGVSEDTRKKVLEAVEANNYKPIKKKNANKSVLILKYRSSGLFVEENQGFISNILDAIESGLRKSGFEVSLMLEKKDLAEGLLGIDYSKYSGMIVIATEISEENYRMLENINIPSVIVDNTVPEYRVNSVCMNNHENVGLALKYLKKCGHKDIGYVGSSYSVENFKERKQAFEIYIRKLGLECSRNDIFYVFPSLMGAYEDSLSILENRERLPSAFFAENDTIALGFMKALKEKGYKVPDAVSVIGFDDIPYSSISTPALTTVRVQRKEIGKQAVWQLINLIDNKNITAVKTTLTGELVIRDSVRDLYK